MPSIGTRWKTCSDHTANSATQAYKDIFTIDLNKIYAAHQTVVFKASQPHNAGMRADLMDQAIAMALRVERNHLRLGTALACAWSTSGRSLRPEPLPTLR